MNKKRLYIALGIIICLAVGFFAGQEYTKYQLRKAITDAFSDFGNTFNNNIDDNKDNTINEDTKEKESKHDKKSNKGDQTIKDKEKVEKEPEVDTSITISKGITESISSTYSSSEVEADITLTEVSFVDEILPPEPRKSFYSYYPAQEGKTYAVAYLKIKNTGASSFDVSSVLKDFSPLGIGGKCFPTALFGGKYKYTVDIVAELEKDNKGAYSYESTFIYIDPLETMDIIVAFSVPNEVKDKDARLNICLGDQKINLDFTTGEPIEKNTIENIGENTEEK